MWAEFVQLHEGGSWGSVFRICGDFSALCFLRAMIAKTLISSLVWHCSIKSGRLSLT